MDTRNRRCRAINRSQPHIAAMMAMRALSSKYQKIHRPSGSDSVSCSTDTNVHQFGYFFLHELNINWFKGFLMVPFVISFQICVFARDFLVTLSSNSIKYCFYCNIQFTFPFPFSHHFPSPTTLLLLPRHIASHLCTWIQWNVQFKCDKDSKMCATYTSVRGKFYTKLNV